MYSMFNLEYTKFKSKGDWNSTLPLFYTLQNKKIIINKTADEYIHSSFWIYKTYY